MKCIFIVKGEGTVIYVMCYNGSGSIKESPKRYVLLRA